jgi:hypothetical protein
MDRYKYTDKVAKEAKVDSGVRNGANWLFAIGTLSIVNTLLTGFGFKFNFIVGLGITGLIDAIFYELNRSIFLLFFLNLFLNILISSVFFILAVYGKKAQAWAFIAALIFYGVDTLLISFAEIWFAVIFHIFGMVGIFLGYRSLRALEYSNAREMMELERSMQENPDLYKKKHGF